MGEFLFGENLKRYFLSVIPSAKLASGGKVINCRCFECGDSSNPRSAHMYLGMPTQNNAGWFYCHTCNCHGYITHRKLLDWNIYDPGIADDLYSHYISVLRKSPIKFNTVGKVYNVINRCARLDELTMIKMQYINNRLGTKLDLRDFQNLKVVLNLNDFLNENNITRFTRNYNIIQDLDRAFVGFLSLDNGFVTLRKIDDQVVYESINKRYVNYKVFDKEDTSERFYVVPQNIDLLSTNRIKLHIAEGAFDILSIYLNLRNREPGIYATVSGSNYSSIISYFMIEKKLPWLEIHLYPDNDKNNWIMKRIIDNYKPFQIPIYIHRNMSPREKDFGVSIDRIKETIIDPSNWS